MKSSTVATLMGLAMLGAVALGYSLAPGSESRVPASTTARAPVAPPPSAPSSDRPAEVAAPKVSSLPSPFSDREEPSAARDHPNPQFEDGTFIVGTDVPAGTYRTRKPSAGCYWERLSGFGGSDIIANNVTDQPSVVTIDASDRGFRSRGCGTWTQDLTAITTSTTSFGDGTFIVSTDIAPGTYRGRGGEHCYWERLSGFGGSEIISNDVGSKAPLVTIAADDKGFASKGCGPWENVAGSR